MIEESISHKTIRTSFWAAIEHFSVIGVHFVVSLILARLLSPSDFGTIAMLTIFIEISSNFVSCGFGNALIRKQDCCSEDFSTAFYFNVFVGVVMYVLLWVIAPLVSDFYNIEILCPLLRWCGLTIIINSFSIVQNSILSKGLLAKKQARIHVFGSLLSAVVGITMAYVGCGIWSLVGQQLSSSIVITSTLWLTSSYRPRLEYSKKSMNYLWGFGSKILLSKIIGTIYKNIYSIVIGKFYTNSVLGLFNRGQSLSQLFPTIVESIFVKNSLAIFSQLQNDNEKLIHVYREYIKLSCFLCFPAVCLIGALAAPFVDFVLTDKWSGCVIYIKIFALTSFIIPANSINLRLLQTYGRSDYTLKAEAIKKSLGLLLVFSLVPLGPLYLAIGKSLFDIFAFSVNLYYAKKVSELRFKDQIKDIIPILLCSIIMYLVVTISIVPFTYSLVKMIVGAIVGVASFYVCGRYIFKLSQFDQIRKQLYAHKR